MSRRTQHGQGRRRSRRWAAGALGALAVLASGLGASARADGVPVTRHDLVSDVPGMARITDPALVNPWGLAAGPVSFPWTANNGTNTSTLYGGALGAIPPFKVPLTVRIPGGAPTGVVFNGGGGFEAAPHAPALFIFDSQGGELTAWSPFAFPIDAARVVHTTPGAVYTGLAIGGGRLFAADLAGGRVDVFDARWQPVDLGDDAFTDDHLPPGYAPFNVQALGGRIYVAFVAAIDGEEQPAPGVGAVDVFDTDGHLLKRLVRGGALNAPWGMTYAPDGFGDVAGELLVGNFGDGTIHAYDPHSGHFEGTLRDEHAAPVTIEGLWALEPGNGFFASRRSVVFTAGIDDETHGLLGTLDAAAGHSG